VSPEATNLEHTALIECDPATTTLTLGGIPNVEPAAASAGQRRHRWFVPIHKSLKVRSPRARFVTVRYTGARPAGVVSDTVDVPVLTGNRWLNYKEGQNGTFRGLPVRCLGKTDGVPGVFGS